MGKRTRDPKAKDSVPTHKWHRELWGHLQTLPMSNESPQGPYSKFALSHETSSYWLQSSEWLSSSFEWSFQWPSFSGLRALVIGIDVVICCSFKFVNLGVCYFCLLSQSVILNSINQIPAKTRHALLQISIPQVPWIKTIACVRELSLDALLALW